VLSRARQEILDIEEEDKKADRIFQLNIQLFPLSKRLAGGGV
jgi:aminopeptidase-like protein